MTHDIRVWTASKVITYRYAGNADGWRLLGVVNPDETIGPVPPPEPLPSPMFHADGRPVTVTTPDYSGLLENAPPAVTMTDAAWHDPMFGGGK